MLLGTVAAIAHGTALPLLMLYFGDLTDNFINQEASSALARDISNVTGMAINCSSVFNFPVNNTFIIRDTDIMSILQFNSRLNNPKCLLGDTFFEAININVYIFLGIALGVLIGAMLEISTFQVAAERQVYKIRLKYYRSLVRQNIAWFDENPTGELVNRLSE